jgi:O-methyltransferase
MQPPSLVGDNVIQEMKLEAMKTPPGRFVEVGVYKGGTAWHLYEICKYQQRRLILCDTFTGIPYADQSAGDSHKIGDFADTSREAVEALMPEAIIVEGIFPESAREEDFHNIAFVHLDCDQYLSYLDSINFLLPRMVPGGVMWFDDYCLEGAKKAVDSIFGDRLQGATCGKHFVRI